jgi:hypothetical protein
MSTDLIPSMPGFHTGFFVAHDHDDKAPAEGLTVIERDRNGVPCFACFFEAMFEAMPMETLDMSKVDTSELEPDVIAYVLRIGASLGYLADALAWVMARALSNPEHTVPIFVDRLSQAIKRSSEDLAAEGVEPVL